MAVSKKDQVYVARESGTTVIKGQEYAYVRGSTRIRGDHPLLKAVPENFERVESRLDHEPGADVIESATAAPGEKRNR